MREWFTAPRYDVPSGANATDDMVENAAERPNHAAFARKVSGRWHPVTSADFAREVTSLAAGLIAAGITPGDRIGLMSATGYEWALCDFAILTAGAVTVPVYETSSAAQVEWILRDSGATAVFVANSELRATVEKADAVDAKHVWLMDGEGLAALATRGQDISPERVEQRRRNVSRADSHPEGASRVRSRQAVRRGPVPVSAFSTAGLIRNIGAIRGCLW